MTYPDPPYGASDGVEPVDPNPYGPQPYDYHPYYGPQFAPQHGPQYGPPGFQTPGTNGMAVASMVLGILWIYWIGSILALVFGYLALGQIRQRGQQGYGMATAGIVLGWVGVAIGVVVIVVVATYPST